MEKLYSLLALAAFNITVFAQTTLLSETFPMPDGTVMNGYNGWVKHSGVASQMKIQLGAARFVAGDNEDVNKAFTSAVPLANGTNTKIKYSAKINVLSSAGISSTGSFFMCLGTGSGSLLSGLQARLWIKTGVSGYLLGICNSDFVGKYSMVEQPYNTDVDIEVTYEVARDESGTVTLNKSTLEVGTETVSDDVIPSFIGNSVNSLALRQDGSAESGSGNISVDNLKVTVESSTLSANSSSKSTQVLLKNSAIENELVFGADTKAFIYSMTGQLIKTAEVEKNSVLDVSALPKGTYIVAGTVDGKRVSQKVIKK